MNVKTKAIGLLTGSALALGFAGGALAQADVPAQEDTSATLNEQDCVITWTVNEDADFGEWTFVPGVGWEVDTPGEDVFEFSLDEDSEQRTTACDVTVQASSLTGGQSTNLIIVELADATPNTSSSDDTNPAELVVELAAGTGSEAMTVTLLPNDAPSNPTHGAYSGTLTVTGAVSSGP